MQFSKIRNFILKEQGASWNGEYFREEILKNTVFPFMSDPECVKDTATAKFLHDNAHMCSANASQQLMRDSCIQFIPKEEWAPRSPVMNPTESVGSRVMVEVEDLLEVSQAQNKYSLRTLKRTVKRVLESMSDDIDYFRKLLLSMHNRAKLVVEANGASIDKY